MSETNLRGALDSHLQAMVGAPAIAWENVKFTQNNQVYLSQVLLPTENITVGVEATGSDVLAGIYQVTVNIPKGTGKNAFLVETEKVKAHFKRGTILNYDGTRIIIHKVWSSPAQQDQNFYRVPISIRYRSI